jgi:hypothetical protein
MIIEKAKPYWTILRRFHLNRLNPGMSPVAVMDMRAVGEATTSPALTKRVNQFISVNQARSPNDSPPNGGPKLA